MRKPARRFGTWVLGFAPVLAGTGQEPQQPVPGKARAKDVIGLPEGYIRYARLPGGGIQPLLFLDPAKGLRVLYFVPRDEGRGDLFTCVSTDEGKTFSEPRRVNATEGGVGAPNGLQRASGALAPGGILHVSWVDASPAGSIDGSSGEQGSSGLVYTRVDADGGVEPERELFTARKDVEMGALAVDGEGRVFAFFSAPEEVAGAVRYRIWAARSTDAGRSFSEPVAVDREEQGVSIDSALAAGVGPKGAVYLLYRMNASFGNPENPGAGVKDTRLLSSVDGGESFKPGFVDNWKFGRDPRSGACLFRGPQHMFVAYEGRGQVYWSHIKDESHKIGLPLDPKRKWQEKWRTRPAVAANGGREVILAYLERARPGINVQGPAEDSEPVLAWQVWDKSRNLPLENGVAPDPPGKSSPAVFVRADGGFTIVY